jgi:hypothetical protein
MKDVHISPKAVAFQADLHPYYTFEWYLIALGINKASVTDWLYLADQLGVVCSKSRRIVARLGRTAVYDDRHHAVMAANAA